MDCRVEAVAMEVDEPQPPFNLDELRHSLKPRKIPVQNIVVRLMRRETFGRTRRIDYSSSRQMYQCVFPNLTIENVEKPPCFLRKFSPDGRFLIAFSSDQTFLEIYRFKGSSAAGSLLNAYTYERSKKNEKIRKNIFSKFFELKMVVNMSQTVQRCNRECSLFSSCGRYVIVGSASTVAEDRPNFYEIYTNNEAVTPNSGFLLEDFTIYLIDMEQGILCDKRTFRVDKIFLSHNQGIYLYQNTLAVLSVQHQTIHIFHIADGKLHNVRQIGRNCFEDDDFLLSCWADKEARANRAQTHMPFREVTINALKHKLLIFLFKKAKRESQESGNPLALRKFYQHFDQLNALRMWKMQLMDREHLLIKYASEEIVTLKAREQVHTQPSFFMVYNMDEAQVLAVYDNTSEELLWMLENYCDYFRNANTETQFTCSPANNIHARLFQKRSRQLVECARNGGHTEAVKRVLALLPISAQSYCSSPYLDLALFSYDEKWLSVMERPKPCGEHPIRFYGRDSGILKFMIHAGRLSRVALPVSLRRLAAFSFHPYEPFAISVQRTNTEYIVNFHANTANWSFLPAEIAQSVAIIYSPPFNGQLFARKIVGFEYVF